jgi:4-hydroxybenzoate polyprenyltransferase
MISRFLSFIRFSHTIFALPFALGSMFVAAHGLPSFRVFALVVLAMIFARTAAMTFNRLADWEIDKRNPRTAGRHKLVSKRMAIVACLISALFFGATAWMINPLCFALSPVALVIVFFYSLTKRFTGSGTRSRPNWSLDSGHRQLRPTASCPRRLRFVLGGRL